MLADATRLETTWAPPLREADGYPMQNELASGPADPATPIHDAQTLRIARKGALSLGLFPNREHRGHFPAAPLRGRAPYPTTECPDMLASVLGDTRHGWLWGNQTPNARLDRLSTCNLSHRPATALALPRGCRRGRAPAPFIALCCARCAIELPSPRSSADAACPSHTLPCQHPAP